MTPQVIRLDDMTFGRYRLLSVIGEGGMGKVYKAHDTVIGRDVAIKVLSTELAAEPGYRERFRREAHAAARLDEPHIIPIYDIGEAEGRLYLVMRIVDGVDVHGLLQRDGPMSPQRAVHIVEQLAGALRAAHAVGLVHRDVKPSNALVTAHDFVYLIDFGIAHDTAATKLTRTGEILGSWAYMAPERLTTGTSHPSADIYALACVLYECLTGASPYPGDSLQQQYTGHVFLDPPRPSNLNSTVPAGFDEVIALGMAKDPHERYASAHDLATAARRALTATPARGPQNASAPFHPTRVRPRTTPRGARVAPPSSPASSRPRRRLKWPVIVGAVAILAIAVITGYLLLRPQAPASQTPTAQPALLPGQTPQPGPASEPGALPLTGLNGPGGVAVDGAGNVYVADAGNSRVLELAADANGPTVLPFSGLGKPSGVAVNASRAVYVTCAGNNPVLKLAAGATSTTELPFSGLNSPQGVAVDSADNLYVTDGANRVLKLPAGSSSPIVLPFNGLSNPTGVAVDGAGAVYVADSGNNRVLKLAAAANSSTVLPFSDLNDPAGVAVDSVGDLYVADRENNRVLKLASGSSAPTALPATRLNKPTGVAVDTTSIYVADAGDNRVLKLSAG